VGGTQAGDGSGWPGDRHWVPAALGRVSLGETLGVVGVAGMAVPEGVLYRLAGAAPGDTVAAVACMVVMPLGIGVGLDGMVLAPSCMLVEAGRVPDVGCGHGLGLHGGIGDVAVVGARRWPCT
jgi:hypothetical protein